MYEICLYGMVWHCIGLIGDLDEFWIGLEVENKSSFRSVGDVANKHLDKFLHVTQSIKVNGVTHDALCLYLFPHSLKHHATAWFDRLPRNSINTFEQMAKMFLGKYFPPSMVTKLKNEITNFRQRPDGSLFKAWECCKLSIDRCPNHNMLPVTQIDTFYNGLTLRHHDTINDAAGRTFMKRRPKKCYDLIKNMTAHHNDWDTSAQWSESSSSITFSSDTEIAALKAEMAEINKNLMRPPLVTLKTYMLREPIKAQVVTTNEFINFMKANDAILKNMQTNMTSLTNSNLELKNMFGQFMKMNTASSSGSGTLPGNTITNQKEDLKGITTRSETAYQGPTIPTTSSSLPPVVKCQTEVTMDMMHPTNNESTKYVQPLVVPTDSLILNYEPVVALIIEHVASSVSAPKPNQKPSIPYPSRFHDQKLCHKANDQQEKFFQIFKDLNFNISFDDALILMPKFGPTIKTLLTNKDKLFELARTPLNEHCSVVLLKKLLETLGDPGKFLIPCDFPRMAECLAQADLGASINLMPLSVWNKLSLPDLSTTCMTLELTDRSISCPVGVAEDVFVKVGTFHFSTDFVVVDFDADPRTRRTLIDVFEGEITLHVSKESITFNLDQTSRYSANYNDMTANRIEVIDMAYEEYLQEVLGFSNVIASDNPTPCYDSIVSTTSPTLTPFRSSDFLLEEVDAFLALEDDPTSPEVDQSYVDTEGDILFFEAFLNDDPLLPPPNQGNYLPQVRKELKICEAKTDKSSIDEPPEVKLKDLSPHIEYAFLKGDDKLRVIIEKDLSVEEKTALIMEDFKPAVQHQRRFNPKIHDVLKNEVLKLLDARLICPISDSPWENSHFMVKEGIVLGHKISKNRIEVDKANVDVIAKLPHPITVKGIRSFLGHAGLYRRKLTEAPILIAPEWDLPFELMCDASDFAIGAVLGQHQEKHFRPIHYSSKTMTEEKSNYTTMENEMLAVVYAFEKFWSYLFMNKSIVYTNHFALKYLFAKKDSKARLLRWFLLLQEFTFKVIDTKGAKNLAADHLSRLENPHQNVLDPKEINESFPLETLNMVSSREKQILQGCETLFLGRPLSFQNLCGSSHPKERFCKQMRCHKTPSKFVKIFDVWGIDFMGPFLSSRENKYILVAIDYLSKWVEAKALPTNDARVVCKFLKNLFARFGSPQAIISDRGTHFCNDQFAKVMLKKVQLNELYELHDQAYKNSLIHKEKTKRLHDSKIKDCVFNISDRVLLFSSRLEIFSGKRKSRWSRPFTISHVYPYGTVELSQPTGPNFKVNGHRLKHYFGEDIPKVVFPDLQTFPKEK
nr:reverse transcriptase domain-containing protein [Tanacetum cinerariifolium]